MHRLNIPYIACTPTSVGPPHKPAPLWSHETQSPCITSLVAELLNTGHLLASMQPASFRKVPANWVPFIHHQNNPLGNMHMHRASDSGHRSSASTPKEPWHCRRAGPPGGKVSGTRINRHITLVEAGGIQKVTTVYHALGIQSFATLILACSTVQACLENSCLGHTHQAHQPPASHLGNAG
jgi:hypothetical protein